MTRPTRDLTVTTPDGAELAVQVSGEGPALLLLPGQMSSHTWWADLRRGFEPHFMTVTFDYRGTGQTRAREDEPWTTPLFTADAVAVLDAVGADRAHVYGTSMGGRIAQVLAGTTDRVDRLVLACTNPGEPIGVPPTPQARRELRSGDAQQVLELFYTPAWFARGVRSRLLADRGMSARARVLHRRASGGHDASDVLHRISAPTLILHGTEDRMTEPGNAEVLHRHIAGSELVWHEGGRHGFFDEFADEITPRILTFLGA